MRRLKFIACAVFVGFGLACSESAGDRENREVEGFVAREQARLGTMAPPQRAFRDRLIQCRAEVELETKRSSRRDVGAVRARIFPAFKSRSDVVKWSKSVQAEAIGRVEALQEKCVSLASCAGPPGWWQYEYELATCLEALIESDEAPYLGERSSMILRDAFEADWPANAGPDPFQEVAK